MSLLIELRHLNPGRFVDPFDGAEGKPQPSGWRVEGLTCYPSLIYRFGMKKEFRGKLKKLGIFTVYLFGSRSTKRGSPLSDIDIGVVLKNPSFEKDTRQLYHALYQLFSDLYPASKLDIVLLQIAPLPLQYLAIKEGQILFEEDPTFTADYENLVVNQYLDFRPVLDFFNRVTMERYAKA